MFEIILQVCSFVVRIIVSVTFISAGYFKLKADTSWFSNVFHTFDFKETAVTKAFLIFLPWVEVGIGVMLFAGFGLKFATVIGTILIIIFTLFVLRAATHSKYLECGCFGKTKAVQQSVVMILTRNIVLLGLLWLLYISPFHIWQSKPILIFNSTMNHYASVVMLISIFLLTGFLVSVAIRYDKVLNKVR